MNLKWQCVRLRMLAPGSGSVYPEAMKDSVQHKYPVDLQPLDLINLLFKKLFC